MTVPNELLVTCCAKRCSIWCLRPAGLTRSARNSRRHF